MKKIRITVVIFLISLLLISTSCSHVIEQERFDAFIDKLPTKFIESNDMTLNYLFRNPKRYGFKNVLLELPYSDESDYEKSREEYDKILTQISKFHKKNLTPKQQLTYDILVDYIKRLKLTLNYYYLDNNYLGSIIGFQAQLPLLLNEFSFNSKRDIINYFNIIESSPEVFLKYAKIEQKRQENGVGMSQVILDKVISQCNSFASNDIFLVEAINEKIESLDYLNDEEKIEYKKKNEYLLKNNFIKAYQLLGDELSKIHGREDDLGLWSLPNGKEYYEAIFIQNTGINEPIRVVRDYLQKKVLVYSKEFKMLAKSNPNSYKSFLESIKRGNFLYSSFESAKENLDFFIENINDDFPRLEILNYNISQVPESMKENFSPACYISNQIDAPLETEESIYINGEFNQNMYEMIAHEGYPGHMYQNIYFKALKLPAIRYIVDCNGYTEGWATYVENYVDKYAPVDDKVELRLIQLNKLITWAQVALMDIGINYDGWTRNEFADYIKSRYNKNISKESIDEQYNLIIEMPANYLNYYLCAMYFEDLKDYAMEKMGNKFSDIKFHKIILETGPAGLDIVKEQVDRYIGQ